MAGVKYEFIKTPDGWLRYRLKAANGKVLAGSAGCESEPVAQGDIESSKDDAPDSADVHEPEQPVETEYQRRLRILRSLKPRVVLKKRGNPS